VPRAGYMPSRRVGRDCDVTGRLRRPRFSPALKSVQGLPGRSARQALQSLRTQAQRAGFGGGRLASSRSICRMFCWCLAQRIRQRRSALDQGKWSRCRTKGSVLTFMAFSAWTALPLARAQLPALNLICHRDPATVLRPGVLSEPRRLPRPWLHPWRALAAADIALPSSFLVQRSQGLHGTKAMAEAMPSSAR